MGSCALNMQLKEGRVGSISATLKGPSRAMGYAPFFWLGISQHQWKVARQHPDVFVRNFFAFRFASRCAKAWVCPLLFLGGVACLVWALWGFDVKKPALGMPSAWHLTLAWLGCALLFLGLLRFQSSCLREIRHAKHRLQKDLGGVWSHISINTWSNCHSNFHDLEMLKPAAQDYVLSGIAVLQCSVNCFFYTYNFIYLPPWNHPDHLMVTRYTVALIEVLYISASMVATIVWALRSLSNGLSLDNLAACIRRAGKFSCLGLLPLAAPARAVDQAMKVWKRNVGLGIPRFLVCLQVLFTCCVLAVTAALGLLALQMKLAQVAFVSEKPADTWSWEEILRFLGFANNIMSIHDLGETKMEFLAKILQDEVDSATQFLVAGGPGTRFRSWKTELIHEMFGKLTRLGFFAFCSRLSAEKLARQIIHVSKLEASNEVRLAVPSILPRGCAGTLCRLNPPIVEWKGKTIPKCVRIDGFADDLGAACGSYVLKINLYQSRGIPCYSNGLFTLAPFWGQSQLHTADGWYIWHGGKRIAWCLGLFMYSPGEACGWWVTWMHIGLHAKRHGCCHSSISMKLPIVTRDRCLVV